MNFVSQFVWSAAQCFVSIRICATGVLSKATCLSLYCTQLLKDKVKSCSYHCQGLSLFCALVALVAWFLLRVQAGVLWTETVAYFAILGFRTKTFSWLVAHDCEAAFPYAICHLVSILVLLWGICALCCCFCRSLNLVKISDCIQLAFRSYRCIPMPFFGSWWIPT